MPNSDPAAAARHRPGPPQFAGSEHAAVIGLSAATPVVSTVHRPFGSPSGPGLFRMKGAQLPAYVQNVARALLRTGRAKDEFAAIQIAVGVIRRWAGGGGKVTPEVRAAAARAIAEWESLKAAAHAHAGDHARVIELVGPKGYIHGWIYVGPQAIGAKVFHPQLGHGTVTGRDGKHATVRFDRGGAERSFEARKARPGDAAKLARRERAKAAAKPAQAPGYVKDFKNPATAALDPQWRQAMRDEDFPAMARHLQAMDKLEAKAGVPADAPVRVKIAGSVSAAKAAQSVRRRDYKELPKLRERAAGRIADTASHVITGPSAYSKTTPEQAVQVRDSLNAAAASLRAADHEGALKHLAAAGEAAKGPGGTMVGVGGRDGRGASYMVADHEKDVRSLADSERKLSKYAPVAKPAARAKSPAGGGHLAGNPNDLSDVPPVPAAPDRTKVDDWSLGSMSGHLDALARRDALHAANRAAELHRDGAPHQEIMKYLAAAETRAPEADRAFHAARLDAYAGKHGLKGWYRHTSSFGGGKHMVNVAKIRTPADGERGRYYASDPFGKGYDIGIVDRDTGKTVTRVKDANEAKDWIGKAESKPSKPDLAASGAKTAAEPWGAIPKSAPGSPDETASGAITKALAGDKLDSVLADGEKAHLSRASGAFARGDHATAMDHLAQVHNSLEGREASPQVRAWNERLLGHANGRRTNQSRVSYLLSSRTGQYHREIRDLKANAQAMRAVQRKAETAQRQADRAVEKERNRPPSAAVRRRLEAMRGSEEHARQHETLNRAGFGAAGGTEWKALTAAGTYSEHRTFNGRQMMIIGSPNGNYKVRLDGKYVGYARTPEAAKKLAERKALGVYAANDGPAVDLAGTFTEALHPRAAGGKFGDKGGQPVASARARNTAPTPAVQAGQTGPMSRAQQLRYQAAQDRHLAHQIMIKVAGLVRQRDAAQAGIGQSPKTAAAAATKAVKAGTAKKAAAKASPKSKQARAAAKIAAAAKSGTSQQSTVQRLNGQIKLLTHDARLLAKAANRLDQRAAGM